MRSRSDGSLQQRLPCRMSGTRPTAAPLRSRGIQSKETEVLRLVAEGMSNPEVARRLGIGRSTLYRKMREFGLEERVS